jgi:hypothetical protein
MKIWKQVLEQKHDQFIELPAFSKIISTAMQGDDLCIWFECYPENGPTRRRIVICYTGHDDVPENARLAPEPVFIGTVLKQNGIVLHIYESFEFTGEQQN